MKKIIPYSLHSIHNDDIEGVIKVLKSRNLTQGTMQNTFADKFSNYVGSKFAVPVSNGTAALHAALHCIDLKKGDEVITTPITFCATANSILYCGGDVRLVDINSKTLNIDPDLIEKKINKRTKAIIPVDFRGHPADLKKIYNIATKYNLKVIEDASHSLGSKYKQANKIYNCGSCKFSDLSTFSFHPVKQITTGEGGMITTNNYKYYKKLLMFVKHGINKKSNMFSEKKGIGSWYYDMFFLGYNFRLTDFQASLGITQLDKLNLFIKRRREIVNFYNESLKNIEHIKVPYEDPNVISNFHIYTLEIENVSKKINRYVFFKYLQDKGYAPMVHYIPLHLLSFYKKRYKFKRGDFPNAEAYYNRAISLPLYYSLKNNQIKKVIEDIKFFFRNE